MVPFVLAMMLAAPPAAPTEVEEVVVSTPKPETVYCVRFYREPHARTARFTCKTHVEWRAIKVARHDTRTRTAAKLMERGFLFDTALIEAGVAASVRPRRSR